MIIYNTTFHAELGVTVELIDFLTKEYIPLAQESGVMSRGSLARVMTEGQQEGESYALQFEVESVAALNAWYQQVGSFLAQKLIDRFQQRVVGFTTLLEQIYRCPNA